MQPTVNFLEPLHISGMATARESCMYSVCGVFDEAFAKLRCPLIIITKYIYIAQCLQCFDAVGLAAGRASGL